MSMMMMAMNQFCACCLDFSDDKIHDVLYMYFRFCCAFAKWDICHIVGRGT